MAALAFSALGGAACQAPATAPGTRAEGRARVLALLDEADAALRHVADYTPTRATGPVTCRRRLVGYAVGTTGAQRVESPRIVAQPGDPARWTLTDRGPALARAAIQPVERLWRSRGYRLDRSGLSNTRFPKVVATVDGYRVVVTGFADRPQATLYAVSPCLRG